jgi:hypothetical protein
MSTVTFFELCVFWWFASTDRIITFAYVAVFSAGQ